mgnify:CR=1 FL=1
MDFPHYRIQDMGNGLLHLRRKADSPVQVFGLNTIENNFAGYAQRFCQLQYLMQSKFVERQVEFITCDSRFFERKTHERSWILTHFSCIQENCFSRLFERIEQTEPTRSTIYNTNALRQRHLFQGLSQVDAHALIMPEKITHSDDYNIS